MLLDLLHGLYPLAPGDPQPFTQLMQFPYLSFTHFPVLEHDWILFAKLRMSRVNLDEDQKGLSR